MNVREIFVFGSNEAGIHGDGAARTALQKFGATYGKGYGLEGDSFAVPTKDRYIRTLPLESIAVYVDLFLAFAKLHCQMKFKVTRIGCGLAGYHDQQIAPLFKNAPDNCMFDTAWHAYLGDEKNYWGSVPTPIYVGQRRAKNLPV